MTDPETIAAIATAPGRSGIGVVRLSGPRVPALAQALLATVPPPRRAVRAAFRAADGAAIDHGLALYFEAPASYTGEHVLELHGHGGPVVLDMLLARALELGARLARPGEFSERAFLNGKLDLAQAEAVADLIDSGSQQAARAAVRSLEGEFSRRVDVLAAALVALRTHVEAALDFADEDIDLLDDRALIARGAELVAALDASLAAARQGVLLNEGVTVVIAGPPNVGKSSLINRLAGRDTAIVTEVPGTTRDVLRERIHLDGLPLHVIDTAGLRESDDLVEREGIRRARAQIAQADLVLMMRDAGSGEAAAHAEPIAPACVSVHNKIDLSGDAPGVRGEAVYVSALTGAGVDALCEHLKQRLGYQQSDHGALLARRRHLEGLRSARAHLAAAAALLAARGDPALIAEELALAHRRLGEITGVFTSEDLLGAIFATFCIGK